MNCNISISNPPHTTSNIHIRGICHYADVLYFLYPAADIQSFPPWRDSAREEKCVSITSCFNRSISHLGESKCVHVLQDYVRSICLSTWESLNRTISSFRLTQNVSQMISSEMNGGTGALCLGFTNVERNK